MITVVTSQSNGRVFESRCWQEVSLGNSYFRFLQLEEIHANDINYDIHWANILF